MHTNIRKVMKIMESIAPNRLAESWDNVGLMVGDDLKMVENILLALEVTEEVIDEAIEKNVDLIITHHPLIFKPLKKVNAHDPISKMVIRLIENRMNLFVAHTNLDISAVGTCHYLSELVGLDRVSYLNKTEFENLFKISVKVPEDYVEKVKQRMFALGAGQIGDYDSCSFDVPGKGQFKPNDQATPFIGKANELEIVDEVNVEMVVKKQAMHSVVEGMLKSHPYEEPAYDIIKLENKINEQGVGVYGFLTEPTTLKELGHQLKTLLKSDSVKLVGDADKKVSKVAIVTGSGSDYFRDAKRKADVLITGDVKYHEAHLAKQLKLAVIDAGHYETETIYMTRLKELLDKNFEEKSYDLKVMISETNINPFQLI